MPARDQVDFVDNCFYHVYNKGYSNNKIFLDISDFETFITYLNEYLSLPADKDSVKTVFTINGRQYKGTPHLPKNYHGQIEIVAYNLEYDHFHLIIKTTSKTSLERFVRSLFTRYSIYFNKKHNRSGSLFDGSYKSAEIADSIKLALLTKYIHEEPHSSMKKGSERCSSYPEYMGKRDTAWINTRPVEIFLQDTGGNPFKNISNLKDFLNNYKIKETELKSIEELTFETHREPEKELSTIVPEEPVSESAVTDATDPQEVENNRLKRAPELAIIAIVLILLLTLGVRSIQGSLARDLLCKALPAPLPTETSQISEMPTTDFLTDETQEEASQSTSSLDTPNIATESTVSDTLPVVAGAAQENKQNAYSGEFSENNRNTDFPETIKKVLLVKINAEYDAVNIRRESNIDSELVGTVSGGAEFQFVALRNGWVEVRLDDNSIGYISAQFVELMGGTN
ncbi:hypothetical protein C4561_04300 [candidate division WWE3 bacterium]|jgi:REP element-mobilizing transposase RayT|uniref:SH3b domain-containing protein n=1 Tax=candidate division WWE3 bacterium TaxID=2053526 RepID=A0A3A4ZD00_UNCKA|nr:MAG: hypothetical protein C4561_04300 [candidate division WWE3 bacterium]